MRQKMIRFQVQLTDMQVETLKQLAAERGVSMAELIREGVDQTIANSDKAERRRQMLKIMDRYHDGAPDVAVNHDKYLDEVYGSRRCSS